MAPNLTPPNKLHFLTEEFDFKFDHENPLTGYPERGFIRTTFTFIDKEDNDTAYWGAIPIRKKQVTREQFEQELKPVPDDWVYPLADPEFAVAPPNLHTSDQIFVKRPKIDLYDPVKEGEVIPSAPKLFLSEIRILEILKQNPHPNIVNYHGVRVLEREGQQRITGLLLDNHPKGDLDSIEHDIIFRDSLDKDVIMNGIESAVCHLHSLGLAHNDLNAANVVIGENGQAVLVDFGSCQPFGAQPISGGTNGWIDESYDTSARKHDLAALPKIEKWLQEQYQKEG
ncbi:kinase-like domain-containing protein [Podospora fimiseda]|uniref:non-specific serine/threonine protein kinase n=1 Tax=Podospora fimiseda TaxID=252190 RepID=A0AAN7BS48_9PEZI|nr:kinase-like domain-containing protein [Podospora fimiseda]